MRDALEGARRFASEIDLELLTDYLLGATSPAESHSVRDRLAHDADFRSARDAILDAWAAIAQEESEAGNLGPDAIPEPMEDDGVFDLDDAWRRFRAKAADVDPDRAALLPEELPSAESLGLVRPTIYEGTPPEPPWWHKARWIGNFIVGGGRRTLILFLIWASLAAWLKAWDEWKGLSIPTPLPHDSRATPYGSVNITPLQNGSAVMMAPGSTLNAPTSAVGEAARTVDFDGEGYFEIAANGGAPFTVRLPHQGLAVRVEGTLQRVHVDVRDYQDDSVARILVTEGKVYVDRLADPSKTVTVSAGQVTDITSTTMAAPHATTDTASWVHGIHTYNGVPFEQVMRDILHWYGIPYIFERPDLRGMSVVARFPVGTPLDSIAAILYRATRVHVYRPGRTDTLTVQ